MSPIKFSHLYPKLLKIGQERDEPPKEAQLISAAVFDLDQLPVDFLEWDTHYFNDKDNQDHNEHYLLPQGKYIVLILFDQDRLFSTLRPYTERKFAYYLGQVGRTFEVVIK